MQHILAYSYEYITQLLWQPKPVYCQSYRSYHSHIQLFSLFTTRLRHQLAHLFFFPFAFVIGSSGISVNIHRLYVECFSTQIHWNFYVKLVGFSVFIEQFDYIYFKRLLTFGKTIPNPLLQTYFIWQHERMIFPKQLPISLCHWVRNNATAFLLPEAQIQNILGTVKGCSVTHSKLLPKQLSATFAKQEIWTEDIICSNLSQNTHW